MAAHLDPHTFDTAFGTARRGVETGTVPFAIVAVAGAEGLVRLEAFPPADGPRIGTNAVCLLASITKPITAATVMRLASTGRFSLTAPLGTWIPELDAAGIAPFSAWHVLTHTTGIVEVDLEQVLLDGGDRAEYIRRTIAAGQAWAPGSRFLYTTNTFDLLATAVERALDLPFEDVMREELLVPLGMSATTFDHTRAGALRAPIAVGSWDGTITEAAGDAAVSDEVVGAYSSLRLAGGGLWSSAADLVRFGRAMLRGGELDGVRVLGRPIVDLMTREVTVNGLGAMPDRLADEHYALGWGKAGAASAGSPLAFGHGGVSGTRLWIDPAYDLVFVYLTGSWGGARETIDEVQLAVYGALG
ncbi:MAG TPA: serine hydrolase domain-containing protein [Candidatus Limnocylindrales bacterium]|nr:serine hydrolase domain-containing protein [Candidatus Limnocylindrales bacterium]